MSTAAQTLAAIARLAVLDELLATKGVILTREAARFGVCLRTIRRDLERLEDLLGERLEYQDRPQAAWTYYYRGKARVFDATFARRASRGALPRPQRRAPATEQTEDASDIGEWLAERIDKAARRPRR